MERILGHILAASLAVILLAGVAQAKGDGQSPPEGYRETLVSALKQVQAKQWQEAMALFEKAHALYPNARTLRGLAIVSFEARRYVDGLYYGASALQNSVRPLTKKQRKDMRELVEQCRTFVARLEVASTPNEVEVLVDGQPAHMDDGKVLLDPGKHQVVVRAPAHVEVVRQVAVRAGQQGQVQFRLQPIRSELPAPAVTAESAEPASAPEEEDEAPQASGPKFVWTWVAGGATLAFGGMALGSWISAQNELSGIQETCGNMPVGGCTEMESQRLIDESSIATKEALTTTGLVLSATALAATGFLIWFEGYRHQDRPVSVVAAPGGVMVFGKF